MFARNFFKQIMTICWNVNIVTVLFYSCQIKFHVFTNWALAIYFRDLVSSNLLFMRANVSVLSVVRDIKERLSSSPLFGQCLWLVFFCSVDTGYYWRKLHIYNHWFHWFFWLCLSPLFSLCRFILNLSFVKQSKVLFKACVRYFLKT